MLGRIKSAEKEIEQLRIAQVLQSAGDLAGKAQDVNGVLLVAGRVPEGVDANGLRALAMDVRNRLGGRAGVVALFAEAGDKVSFVVATTGVARDKGLAAGKLVGSFAPAIEGRGGGKPDMAQGGGTKPAGVDDAVVRLRKELGGA
jgi:alanyl-tRNA synthetase